MLQRLNNVNKIEIICTLTFFVFLYFSRFAGLQYLEDAYGKIRIYPESAFTVGQTVRFCFYF